jgi:soluble lytic murein transglycosylase-like protein
MSGSLSMGETIGAAIDTRALSMRVRGRSARRISRLAASVLLAALLGGSLRAAVAAPAPTETPTVEPSVVEDMIAEGVARYESGAPGHAAEIFLNAAEADPHDALPWIWAGIASTAAGNMKDADRYFKEGLAQTHTEFQDRIIRGWLTRLTVFTEPAPVPPRAVVSKSGTPEAIAALARATNPRLTTQQALWLGDRVVSAAEQHHVDPWLVAAVIYVESKFNQSSISRRGALGFGQLMPHTARAAGVNPRDPWGNLLGTAITLRGCIDQFRDWRLALAAYNAGSTAVHRYRGIPPFAETRWYVTAVLEIYRRIHPV